MPGYTHMQHAQVVSVGQWLMAYFSMLKRDKELLDFAYERTDVMPLASGALAGSNYNLHRKTMASLLGFKKISENSMDAVSDRDFMLDFLYFASSAAGHLSRLSEEIIIYNSSEFSFIEIDDSFATGSSIMPQKKNPDFAELIRGKSGRLYGNLVSMLTVMKGIPLSYNRDMQEDKEPLFDSVGVVKHILDVLAEMTADMKVDSIKMVSACKNGYILATDIADYLVSKGVPFRNAHGIVGRIVEFCIKNKKSFEELPISDWKEFSGKFTPDIFDVLDYKKSVEKRKSYGGTSLGSVKNQLKKL